MHRIGRRRTVCIIEFSTVDSNALIPDRKYVADKLFNKETVVWFGNNGRMANGHLCVGLFSTMLLQQFQHFHYSKKKVLSW